MFLTISFKESVGINPPEEITVIVKFKLSKILMPDIKKDYYNYGRRNIAILGLLGYSISLIALITQLYLVERNILHVAYLFPALVLGRLINGLVGSATRPASFAYVADTSTKEKRTVKFARLESSFLLGTVAGPLLGGFLFLITNFSILSADGYQLFSGKVLIQ